MKGTVALLVALGFAGAASGAEKAPAKADAAAGQAIVTKVCAACHAADGNRGSPAYPILQGQHPEYLAKQLHEFKNGTRASMLPGRSNNMIRFAQNMTDEEIKQAADLAVLLGLRIDPITDHLLFAAHVMDEALDRLGERGVAAGGGAALGHGHELRHVALDLRQGDP